MKSIIFAFQTEKAQKVEPKSPTQQTQSVAPAVSSSSNSSTTGASGMPKIENWDNNMAVNIPNNATSITSTSTSTVQQLAPAPTVNAWDKPIKFHTGKEESTKNKQERTEPGEKVNQTKSGSSSKQQSESGQKRSKSSRPPKPPRMSNKSKRNDEKKKTSKIMPIELPDFNEATNVSTFTFGSSINDEKEKVVEEIKTKEDKVPRGDSPNDELLKSNIAAVKTVWEKECYYNTPTTA